MAYRQVMMSSMRLFMVRLFLVMVLMAVAVGAEAQRITGETAAGSLERGDYPLAYEQYTTLIENFPRDPHYLHGAGVALVYMRQRPAEAITFFERALSNSSVIRSAPAETLFYLGRARQLAGEFEEAIVAYEQYATEAGRRESRRAGVPELIKECREERGRLSPEDITMVVVPDKEEEEAERLPAVIPPDMLLSETDALLTEALRQRRLADTTGDSRARRVADSLMTIAGVPEVDFVGAADMVNTTADTHAVTTDIDTITADTHAVTAVVETVAVGVVVTDTIADTIATAITDTTEAVIIEADTLTQSLPQEAVREEAPATRPTSLFELIEGGYYSEERPVTVSEEFPGGLLHTIQFGAFRNPLAPSYFKRLYPVFGIRSPGRDVTFYYTGLFRRAADAGRALQHVRNEGFRDAFVASFFDGRRASEERASILEEEWKDRPLPAWEGVVPEPALRDTMPQTLMLRVEVLRTDEEGDEDLQETVRQFAGDKGFDVIVPEKDIFIYVVGNFLTFESASSYADLLRRNGYLEARVTAYIGKREIPVETALKLMGIKR
jgi:tetratricopeptide (TPR) repeat protein